MSNKPLSLITLLRLWNPPKKVIPLPESLMTNPEGFDFLSKLLIETKTYSNYILDFNNVKWFEANLCAVLGSIIVTNQNNGSKFECININNEYLKKTLQNNGFLELLGVSKRKSGITSGIPLKMFDMRNEDEVEDYIYRYLLSSTKVPTMSNGAKRKIFRSIFEIYQNSVMHSGADKIFVCGQYYYNKGRIALTMVEIGRTFKQNVTTYKKKYSNYSGSESIEWAVQSGNTTKSENETGGLGLDLIRSFLKLNHGKLQIKSAEGYWEEKKDATFALNSQYPFEGSVVNIEFNLRDSKTYYVPEDLDIKDIL